MLICCFSPRAADSESIKHLLRGLYIEAVALAWAFISRRLVFPSSKPGFENAVLGAGGQPPPEQDEQVFVGAAVLHAAPRAGE